MVLPHSHAVNSLFQLQMEPCKMECERARKRGKKHAGRRGGGRGMSLVSRMRISLRLPAGVGRAALAADPPWMANKGYPHVTRTPSSSL